MKIIKKIIKFIISGIIAVLVLPIVIFLLVCIGEYSDINYNGTVYSLFVITITSLIITLFGLIFFYKKWLIYPLIFVEATIAFVLTCTTEMELSSASSYCLESGQGVWDYEQNICRHDCLRWTKEEGCISLCQDNEIWDDEKGCLKKSEEE